MKIFDIFMQWLHISSVTIAVGGMFLLRFIACPAMTQVFAKDENARKIMVQAIIQRFKLIVHGSVALLLASGGYLLWRAWPLVINKQMVAYRHTLELKILLALFVFFVSIRLTATKPEPNFFQRKRDCWLTVNFILALIVIGLAAFLRRY